MESKKITFIVPVYKTANVLTRCLDSIFNQDLEEKEFEVIVVNDGSPDNAEEVITEYSSKHTNIKYITQPNQGLSVARNEGMKVAKGKYLAFVDSDDSLVPHSFKKIIDAADKWDCDLCFFYSQFYPKSEGILNKQPFELYKIYTGEYALLNGMHVSSVWANIYRRKFVDDTSLTFLPGIYHQDVDFNYRLYPLAKKIIFTDIIGYNYTNDLESTTHTRNLKKLRKGVTDTIILSHHLREYSNEQKELLSNNIKSFYSQLINSTTAGNLLNVILNEKKYGKGFLKVCIDKCIELGLYPIKGHTQSKKINILLPLFNCKPLLILATKIINSFK